MKTHTVSTEEFWQLMCTPAFVRTGRRTGAIAQEFFRVVHAPEDFPGFIERKAASEAVGLVEWTPRLRRILERLVGSRPRRVVDKGEVPMSEVKCEHCGVVSPVCDRCGKGGATEQIQSKEDPLGKLRYCSECKASYEQLNEQLNRLIQLSRDGWRARGSRL